MIFLKGICIMLEALNYPLDVDFILRKKKSLKKELLSKENSLIKKELQF